MASIGQRVALIAIAAGALLAASCGGGGSAPGSAPEEEVPPYFPLTVERADGEELTFERPARRIVSLSPGNTEVLFAIGAGDRVIAVDTESALLDQVDLLGEITAHREESDSLVDSIDSRFLSVLDKVGATAGPRV